MQGELSRTGAPVAVGASARTGAISTQWAELWRGGWVIFVKHMRKFASNSMEIGGTLGWPILWVVMFGLGMERMVDTGNLGGAGSYLAFITPGIIALTALSGAVNAGMVLLEEKTKGVLKEYFVAPIPRMSILLASTGSGLVKTLIQTAIILILAVVLGARITGGFWGLWGAAIFLLLYVMAFVGFSNGMAARSKSVGVKGKHETAMAVAGGRPGRRPAVACAGPTGRASGHRLPEWRGARRGRGAARHVPAWSGPGGLPGGPEPAHPVPLG